ncbi:hypothetical protein BH10PAT1_BH10PAT1_3950 [soil metagenome]
MRKILVLVIFIFALIFLLNKSFIYAEDCNQACQLQKQIAEYQDKISQLQGQANTLSNQIAAFDAQINLAELKIQNTEEQINLLSGRIDQVHGSLEDLTKAFSARAIATYKMSRTENSAYLVLSADDLGGAISKFHYLQEAENSDQNLLQRLQAAQTTYENSKHESEDLQKQLKTQQDSLNVQKLAKAKLLNDTKGNESNYQKLLSQAQAQLSQLAGFAQSVGSNLIPHQDLSDSWGKYYNQRDSQWGGVALNSSSYSISEVGCLITSYAMVSSHFGGSILPPEVASNPGNFAANTALFVKPGPSANGHSAEDVDNPYQQGNQNLKDALASGAAVIAGLSRDGGPYPAHYSDHWVVLRSVDGNSFKINDPLYPGAMNVSLSDHYSGWTIIQAKIYR